jgi:ATP-dependent exoDNAse (exonuclease V) beta subunit
LTDLPEIIDVLALTRALSHQGDRHAWLALLRSPWVGLRWSDLHALVRNERSATVWEQLGDENALSSLSQEARAAIEKFRVSLAQVLPASRAETLRDRIERAWLALGGAAILEDAHAVENVYRFLDVIEGIEVAGNIADIAELENALDKEHVSSNVNARLQVMTMHRAKGLQFDHVLLFGLGRTPRATEQTVLSWFDIPGEHGSPRKVISPVGPRAELDKDAVHSYIGKVESEKDRHELGRLLYVACTRARKSLHLLGHARLLKSGMRPDSRSLLHLLWPMVAAEFERLYDPDSHSIVAGQEDPWIMPVLRRFSTSWCMPATPALPADRGMPDESGDKTPVEFYWVGTGARFAGTLAHRWIQLATDGQVDLADLDEGSVRNSSTRWLREQGVSGAAGVAIVERVVSTLRSMSTDSRGQWLLSGEGHAELALSGIIDGRLEAVILDRVRVDEDGTHWIVDYKTSSHEGGDLHTFLEAETERYRPQLTRYTELYRRYSGAKIRCALYFPLLQEFVEVKL